ncbi:TIGR02678 family protein [Nocardioides sp. Kera G14]|uniref:TIGR02678 family protein n=1 Tax=Nocardioides sp. Kera G14 TaxID=2884264 RepID=UPI001D11C05D|nr:TIGR02678 family protein [Nocardioides sp. Kera G14]UDY25018.1 TIGR02678 family protein [Nocardioides sp. Kera G14]
MTTDAVPLTNAGTATRTQAEAERRAAARALLAHPVLTAAEHPEEMALVRRHATALKQTFSTQLGYPLVIESSFARLAKTPLPADAPTRGARRSNGVDFTPRAYTHLALVCAGLLAPGIGEQVLLSTLVGQLRADAASAGIAVDDSITDRRALVAAVDLLVGWGVLVETDGSVAAWGERREEALLTVNRSLLPHLLSRPLYTLGSPDELWQADPDAREKPRLELRRRLAENPLTRREDLTEAEADVLSRERRDVARALEDHFGLILEVRAEGALAYDPDEELTDVGFPGNGTIRQAALLLLDALTDNLRPTAGTAINVPSSRAPVSDDSEDGEDGEANGSRTRHVPGVLAPWEMVAEELEDLTGRNARSWRADVSGDLDRLRTEVVDLLEAVSLVTATSDGLALHPACFRYRPQPVRSPARSRRATGGEPTDALDSSSIEPSLFDTDSEVP